VVDRRTAQLRSPATTTAFQWSYWHAADAWPARPDANSRTSDDFNAPAVGPAGAALKFADRHSATANSIDGRIINVTDVLVNLPPVASLFISPLNANEGQTVTLDGTALVDPDGTGAHHTAGRRLPADRR
jgi:hypothetical protein